MECMERIAKCGETVLLWVLMREETFPLSRVMLEEKGERGGEEEGLQIKEIVNTCHDSLLWVMKHTLILLSVPLRDNV